MKAKLIHDWIADTIAYDVPASLTVGDVDVSWQKVIRSSKTICAGYAALFKKLCDVAGLECKIIRGYTNSPGYRRFGILGEDPNHDWNAVRLEGVWFLVNVTWDSGYVDDSGVDFKSYATTYFLAPPRDFILDHFPEGIEFQLLEKPISHEEYEGTKP